MKDRSHDRDIFREVWSSYKYRDHVPLRGLQIDGRPALTGLTPPLVGDYVLLFVRDPLCAYDEDPATQLSHRLERPQLALLGADRALRPEPAGVLKLEPLCGATAFVPMLRCSRVACARLGLIFTSQILRPL